MSNQRTRHGGRRPKPAAERADHVVRVCVTPPEHEVLAEAARRDLLSLSLWMRRVCLAEAERQRGLRSEEREPEQRTARAGGSR